MKNVRIFFRKSNKNRFKILDLPLLAFEIVVSQLDPIDLFHLALLSTRMRKTLRKLKLAEFCDVDLFRTIDLFDLKQFHSIDFSIQFKSARKLTWKFKKGCRKGKQWPPMEKMRKFELGGVKSAKNFKCTATDTIISYFPQKTLCKKVEALGDQLLSIFPCRIRKNTVGRIDSRDKSDKMSFDWKSVEKCEIFELQMYYKRDELVEEALKRVQVAESLIISRCRCFEEFWMEYEKIRNLRALELNRQRVELDQFLQMDYEHITFNHCALDIEYIREFLKKWQNGGLRRLKTLKVKTTHYDRGCHGMIEGLKLESVGLLAGKEGVVRFSDTLYLNPTPQYDPTRFRTILLKNCHGQLGTIVKTRHQVFFVVWHLPFVPVNVPRGHRLITDPQWPFSLITPLAASTFQRDEQVDNDFNGFCNLSYDQLYSL